MTMAVDVIAAARQSLAETERMVHAVLADPGHVTDSPAAGTFMGRVPS
ncbi:hypothetical protein [Nonomuraea basaltis]|nr:hypothetical protein [Nonomuraea basaltis]